MTDQATSTTTDVKLDTTTTTSPTTTTTTPAATDTSQQTTTTTDATTTAPTLLGDKGAKDDAGKQTVPADWPEAWRDKFAEAVKPGDKKFRDRLERFASPTEVARSWQAIEQKVSAGELKPFVPFPETGTDEQKLAWRKEAGVPEKPENYSVEIPGGAKLDESDAPVLNEFLKSAHAQNWTQADVTRTLASFHQIKQAQDTQIATFDGDAKQKGEDVLRAEWGPADYRRNINAVDNLLSTMPEELSGMFIHGRLADGRLIGSDPRVIKWLSGMAMQYPSLVPASADAMKGATDRLQEIRQFRRENPDKYDQDKAMQAEELKLLELQTKQRPRAA